MIYNCKGIFFFFFKVNALRKERSWAYSQDEICLKFSLAEGRLKAVLDQFDNCLCHELCELGRAIFPVMTRTMKVFDYRASIKSIMLTAYVSEAII